MAHVQKFSKAAVTGLAIHIERKTENHANKEIDSSKSYLNYDLCELEGNMNQRLTKRLSEVHCFNRADVKVMADWLVTLPKELKYSTVFEQDEFFATTYAFLSKRYGEENVLSATVHYDETTPHMHFAFVPVVYDTKKQRYKVSAKEVLTRKELQSFHTALDQYLKTNIPEIYQSGILNDQTIGIEDIPSLKKQTAYIQQKKKELAQEQVQIQQDFRELEQLRSRLSHTLNIEAQWTAFEEQLDRTLTGKWSIRPEHLTELHELVTGLGKKSFHDHQTLLHQEKKTNHFEKEVAHKQEELNTLKTILDETVAINDEKDKSIDFLTSKNILLESLCKDTDPQFFIPDMSELEMQGRFILHELENGHAPKTKKQGLNWRNCLEQNLEAETIPFRRLERALQVLKIMLERLLTRINQISRDR